MRIFHFRIFLNNIGVDKLLPKELRNIVNITVTHLGTTIKNEEGNSLYNKIEEIRLLTKKMRNTHDLTHVKSLYRKMCALKQDQQEKVVKAFSLKMEIINTCENAYRSWKLSQRSQSSVKIKNGTEYYKTTFVLTAHPTEARSPQLIVVTQALSELILQFLDHENERKFLEALEPLFVLLWKIPLSRETKPKVEDEAKYIVDIILTNKCLLTLLDHFRNIKPIQIRTWVGGDKDGHPGVNRDVSKRSLEISRKPLINYCQSYLEDMEKNISLQENRLLKNPLNKKLLTKIALTKKLLEKIYSIEKKDGARVEKIKNQIAEIIQSYKNALSDKTPSLVQLETLLKLFPAFVIPVEMREDAEIVGQAVKSKKEHFAIREMLEFFKEISQGSRVVHYSRGLILSMVRDEEDWKNGVRLIEQVFSSRQLPVIPLFEKKAAIENSDKILNKFLSADRNDQKAKKFWGSRIEVMLGYSDSSKEIGVLPSRHFIANSLYKLDREFQNWNGLIPIYFHGSGGSVARGGGSIEEQSSWWPRSALKNYKVTLQGEMVQRSFSSDQILKRNLEKIIEIQGRAKSVRHQKNSVFEQFCQNIEKMYRDETSSQEFLKDILNASPYPYLAELKIGSRPAKRKDVNSVNDLRAIPWILCWTQSRMLFPTWWGVGTSWAQLSGIEKKNLIQYIRQDALSLSFVKQLGFTLQKVELEIWALYLRELMKDKGKAKEIYLRYKEEYKLSCQFVRAVSGKKSLLWFKPWLEESITLRSPSIHPLNVIQVIALKNKNIDLLRKTVTGISSGMMTTG